MSSRQFRQPSDYLLVLSLVVATVAALFFNGKHMQLYAVTLAATLVTLTVALIRASSGTLQFRIAGLSLFALTIWSASAISWSLAPFISMIAVGTIAVGVAAYIAGCLEFNRANGTPLTHCLIAGHVAVVAVMIGQALSGYDPALTFSNVNSASGFLNLLWPVTMVAVLARRPDIRQFSMACVLLALTGLTINLTGSRGALLGALIALVIVALVTAGIWHLRRRTLVLAGSLIVGALVWEIAGNGLALMSGLQTVAAGSLHGTSRMLIWTATWELIQQSPWLGIGPGIFWLAYAAIRPADDGSAGYFAHNALLQYWVEQGIPGVLLLLVIGLACAWLFMRGLYRARGAGDNASIARVTSSFAAIAAVCTHAMFTYNLSMTPFLLVLGIHMARLESGSAGPAIWRIPIPDFRQSRRARLSLLLFLIPFAYPVMVSGSFAKIDQGARTLERGNFAEAAQLFTTARAFWSQPDYPWYLQANANVVALREANDISPDQRMRLVNHTNQLLDEARDRNPLRPEVPFIRGQLRKAEPDLTAETAAQAFEHALSLNPRYIRARYELALLWAQAGERKRAADLVNEGLRLRYTGGIDTRLLDELAEALRQGTPPDQVDRSIAPDDTSRLR